MDIAHVLPPLPAAGSGTVVTFYSRHGGAGRSMALVHSARLLAGRCDASVPTLMIDWDLQTPSLQRHAGARGDGPGVLEFFEACREQLQRRSGTGPADAAQARQVLAAVGWQNYLVRVDQDRPLFLMRAGRVDAGYDARLAQLQWDDLLVACPSLFRCFAELLARHFNYVLVDAGSGNGDHTGICTTLLPSRLVLLLTPERRSLEGLAELAQCVITYRRTVGGSRRPLLVYPLPSNMDMNDAAQRALCRRGAPAAGLPGYQPLFEQALAAAYGLPRISLESYFDEVQLQQAPGLSGKRPANWAEPLNDRFSLARTFDIFLDWLAGGHCPWQSRAEIALQAKIRRAREALADGAAESVALARALDRLGELCLRDGRLSEAQFAWVESHALYVRVAGEDQLETLALKGKLAGLFMRLDQLDEAAFLLDCAAEARTRLQGAEHPDTLDVRAAQAELLARQGMHREALACQQAVLAVHLRRLGPRHAQTLLSQAACADLLRRGGELAPARHLQQYVLTMRIRLLGSAHADTQRARDALALTMAQWPQAAPVSSPRPVARLVQLVQAAQAVYPVQLAQVSEEVPAAQTARAAYDGAPRDAIVAGGAQPVWQQALP
ncbi:MAG: tetratricopeptide repeat protein [Pseudomonadota bacterium]